MTEDETGEWLDSYVLEREVESGASVSLAVVEAIARASGTEPTDMTALYHVVDPDALDQLVAGAPDGGNDSLRVTFPYEGYRVTVEGDNRIVIRFPLEEAEETADTGPGPA